MVCYFIAAVSAIRLLAACLLLATCAVGHAAPKLAPINQRTKPDTLELHNGSSLRGLILKNTANSVIFQSDNRVIEIPKSEIRRIRDEIDAEVYFPDITGLGMLPSWQAMVFDLRNTDEIESLQQIPATRLEEGILRHIPYLSFRINTQSEFNIYGDPNNPVAIEFGMYGRQRRGTKYHRMAREFLAGHLNKREEIAALYALSFKGDSKKVGNLVFTIVPPKDADSDGGWWLCVYNAKRIEAARVPEKQYAAVTRPFKEVNHRDGRLRKENQKSGQNWLAALMTSPTGATPKIRGFYRDKQGIFRLLTFDGS